MTKYKFSVIIPIYNVEEYLSQTIDSVINQSIGFEENIQLILINDGSPDNSESICLDYQKKYPNNIIYYKQKNAGVSVARNKGIEMAEGEFINFLDSDDLWDKDAFKEVYNNYKKNTDINLLSCKMCFFDAKKGNHPLNYKYNKNKVIDILTDFKYPQLSSSSIFIKRDAIGNHRYDKLIKYSEDNKFINEIIFEQKKFMVLKKPTYFYRRRISNYSAIQSSTQNKDWYNITPKKVYEYLFDLSKKKFGQIIKYIQFLVAYDINWRINVIPMDELKSIEKHQYIATLKKLLELVDDDVILATKNADFAKKAFLFSVKYDKSVSDLISYDKDKVRIKDIKININQLEYVVIDRVYFKDSKMYIYGKLDTKFVPKKDFKILINNEVLPIEYYELTNNSDIDTYNGDTIHQYVGIKVCIDISKNSIISFLFRDTPLVCHFKRNNLFCEKLPNSFRIHNNKLITYNKQSRIFIIQNKSLLKRIKYEVKNDIYLTKNGKIKVALIRLIICFLKAFKQKKIMLISDRINKADDNGEHFFKYMIENHPEYKTFFVLSRKSVDYERVSRIGNVIDYNSPKYKLLFQICDFVVSSQAEEHVTKVLGSNNAFVQDKYDFKFVFLQHGIIYNNLSPWLNINTKRIDMFVTSSKMEYESLLEYKYYYGTNIVKLTGLPRYDSLIKKNLIIKPKKQILVSFTWRKNLASEIDNITGKRLYNSQFKQSIYFQKIDELFKNKKLISALEKYQYKIKFCPHPNVLPQLKDFTTNEFIEIEDKNIEYQKEFCENSLMITDYSSVFFDFCYLKKPVVYFQHDRETFFDNQLYDEGYFDYVKMGFGPVSQDVESLVNTIIKYIKNDCKMEDKYIKRVDKFYMFKDDKNCERVFNEIEKL